MDGRIKSDYIPVRGEQKTLSFEGLCHKKNIDTSYKKRAATSRSFPILYQF